MPWLEAGVTLATTGALAALVPPMRARRPDPAVVSARSRDWRSPTRRMKFRCSPADTAIMSEQAVGRMLWAVMFAVLVGSVLTFAASRIPN